MGAQNRRPYTEADDRFIKDHFGDWSNRQIAVELGRTESGIRYRAKKLGLCAEHHELPKASDIDGEGESRLRRLKSLRKRMEREIDGNCIPVMQKPAYFREYRALLKDIEEIEEAAHGKDDNSGPSNTPIADAIAGLIALQREILDRARES